MAKKYPARAVSLSIFLSACLLVPLGLRADDAAAGIRSATALSAAFQSVAESITPAVVNISSVKKAKPRTQMRGLPPDPFFDQFRDFLGEDPFQPPEGFSQQGMGTGVLIDKEGHILTNNHVIGDADEVTVRLSDGKKFKAEVVGSDPASDVAVVKIKADNLKYAQLGDSDQLKIGEWVIAAGNPFGLDNSITAGIVSAKGRSLMGGGQYEDFIQTDAAINPGNSGGPLVNLQGQVVGINTAIFSKSGGYMGIGFAIPINMAKSVMESILSKGKVVRGWLGVGIQELTPDLAESFNYKEPNGAALVGQVEKEGPAAKAGVKQGDIITAVDGEKIKNINSFRNHIASVEPGKKVELSLIRGGKEQTLTVKIGELPSSKMARRKLPDSSEDSDTESMYSALGLTVETLTPNLASHMRIETESGVVVQKIDPDGPAARAGIRIHDVITSVNGNEIDSAAAFGKAVKDADLKKGVRLVVQTGSMTRFVFLKEAD